MKKIFYPENTRGSADHGWLKAKHSFSFASYQDRTRMNFGLLRVLNDDTIEGAQGFGTHPHDNMEIITIPRSGALAHQDSTGAKGTITKNEIQMMSAGSGLTHSEFNASQTEACSLFQIWIFPKEKNIAPRYDQITLNEIDRVNTFYNFVSPEKNVEGKMWINQNAWLSMATLEAGKSLGYKIHHPGNGVYFMNVEGELSIADTNLSRRDALGISEADQISVTAKSNSEILVIEVPMEF